MMNKLIFIYFAAVILVSALLTITRRNPVHSVMFMLLLFFHIAGVFVLLNAEFLAAVQLIVYAGAILILYLFVVMLLNVDKESSAARANRFWPWMVAFGLLIAGEIILLISRGTFPAEAGQPMRLAGTGVRELGDRTVSEVSGALRDRIRHPPRRVGGRGHAGEEKES